MSKFTFIAKNMTGKDYICSDIHGHFFLLEQKLEQVSFNPEKDRLFCLGDLIDRSADSPQVLDYLKKSWFYSILGNHEFMLIDACETDHPEAKQQWFSWGGHWAENLSDDELDEYYQAFIKLPIAIELELTAGKKVGLVHANLPDKINWLDVKETLESLANTHINHYGPLLREMLWESAPVYENYSLDIESVENIDHVFHGHTIVKEIIVLENRTFMDLGSYKHSRLGFIQPDQYLNQLQIKKT